MLIPLECEFFSLRGVALLLDTIDKVRERLNFDLELEGILATMYDSRTTHCRQVLQRVVEAFGDKVYQTVITKTVKFPESTVAGAPITTLDPASSGARNYRQLAREVIAAAGRAVAGLRRRCPPRDYGRPVTATPAWTRRRRPRTAGRTADAAVPTPAAGRRRRPASRRGFTVRLANFTGPFDLLLQLIGKHKLDVTEVALHKVTDEFIAYIRAMGDDWDLDEASEFLVIAATLLDLKAARLLPAGRGRGRGGPGPAGGAGPAVRPAAAVQGVQGGGGAHRRAGGGRRAALSPRGHAWSRGTPRRCPTWCSASARSGCCSWRSRR